MKKFLHCLALIAASVIPGTGMAATSYGIYFAGTMINSDNCQNLTSEYLKRGTVKYDYSTNTLTLNNVFFYVNNQSYFINVTPSAKNGLKVVVEGYNEIGKTNGIAFYIQKPTGASASSPSVYFQGTGVLTFQECGIETNDGAGISFGKSSVSNTDGGLDIYAKSIISRNNGGYVWISDANLHLSGNTSGNGTFGGFTSVYMYNGIKAYSEDGTKTYSYSSSVLKDENGNTVKGPAYIGYEKYGLNLCGTEVTAGNYNRLNPAALFTKGSFSYSPSTKTLNMRSAVLNDTQNSTYWKHYCIVNNIDGLKVNVTGNCRLSDSMGGYNLYSTGDVTFQGGGLLEFYNSVSNTIYMATTGKTVTFSNMTVNAENGSMNLNDGTLSLSNSWVDIKHGVKNISKLVCSKTAITTDGVYYDDRANKFYKIGSTAEYTGELNFRPVSTYYGIQVCGVEMTEYNREKVVAPYLEKGTISYDSLSNTLTLDNIYIDTKERGAFPAIIVHSRARTGMKIKLVGNNVIKKTNGAAFCFQKPSNATSVSSAHYFIDGTGSLTLEDCGFLCYDFCNLCFGSGVQGGQGLGGCTVNAKYIQSRTKGDGRIWFTDCMMTLTGSDYGTFINFDDVFTSSHCIIRTPENGQYDSTNNYLADANGNKVTGEVYIGWQKYGLKICGVEVNEIIKDHIQDLINPTPSIQNINSSGSHPAYDCFKYDPSTKTLYMKNVYINDSYNKADPHAVCIENTGDELHIQCEGTNRIAMSRGNTAAIYSTKSLEFRGSGLLQVYASTRNAIEMAGSNQYVKFYYCNTEVDGTSGQAIYAEPENKFRLYVEKANVTVKGSVHGIACYELNYAAISTPQVFIQPANETYLGCFRKFGQGEYFGETVFTPTTTSYGILVSGHELNNVNCNNFYYDDITTGNVSYDLRSNTLTLDNVTATCLQKRYISGEVRDWRPNGMNIRQSAADNLKINLLGNNVFNSTNGVGIEVSRSTTFQGDGTFDISNCITSYEGSNITFAENCTVNAQFMYGSESNGGEVHITNNATLNLTGNYRNSPTVYGFSRFYSNGFATNQASTRIITPNRAWYDTSQKKLVTHLIDGKQIVYGPVKVAPVTFYGVVVQGIDVSSDNYDDIFRDLPHEGTMRYDQRSHALYLENFKVAGTTSTVGLEEYAQGKSFSICLKGENEVSGFGYLILGDNTDFVGFNPGKLSFTGSNFGTNIIASGSLGFDDCTIDGLSYAEYQRKDDDATSDFNVWGSSLSFLGNYRGNPTISGFSALNLYNAEIVEPVNYTDTYSGKVVIEAVEDYGISIGGTYITSRNKDDVFGDGTVRLDPNGEEGEYYLYLTNANLASGIYHYEKSRAEAIVIMLEGNSSITVGQEPGIYAGVPVGFTSTNGDGTGSLTIDSRHGMGIDLYQEGAEAIILDCEVNILSGANGISGPGWWTPDGADAAGTTMNEPITDYPTYLVLLGGNHETRVKIDTETYGGWNILYGTGVIIEGDYEILQPEDCIYDNLQLTDKSGTPYNQATVEVVVKAAKISVDDITRLIDMYLEPYSNITVQDITDLIDRYLEQE